MKKKQVINPKNYSSQVPIFSTITMWLFLDRLQAAGWVWGVVGTIGAIIWIVKIYSGLRLEKWVDIFEEEKQKSSLEEKFERLTKNLEKQ